MTILDYINTHYGGNQAAFARAMGVHRQQVTRWLAGGWVVIGDKLYSPQRTVTPPDALTV